MSLLRFSSVWTAWFQAVKQLPGNFLGGAIVFFLISLFSHLVVNFNSILDIFLPSSFSNVGRLVGVVSIFTVFYGMGYFFGRMNGQSGPRPYDIAFFSGMFVLGMPIDWFFFHSHPILVGLLVAIPQVHVYTAGVLDGSKRAQVVSNMKPTAD